MGIFDIGGSYSDDWSQSTGEQWTNSGNTSDSWSLADAFNSMFGTSYDSSQQSSASQTYVDPAQQGAREALFSSALGAADPDSATANAKGSLAGIMPGLQGAMESLGGMLDPSQLVKAQSAALSSGLGDMFRTEINPALEGAAIASGGFGGGRQGVAQGVATGELASAYTSGLADIMSSANNQSLSAAQGIGSLGSAIYGLERDADNAGLGVLDMLSGIIGPGTVLSTAGSQGTSAGASQQQSQGGSSQSSGSSSQGWSDSYGYNWGDSGKTSGGFDFGF